MARIKGLCAIALVFCVFAAAVQADKCRTGCHGVTPNIFKYQDGTTYKYNLEGNIDVSLSSAENQHTSTKITGVVLLTQQSNCNQILRLQNIQIIGPDAKKYAGIENLDKSIRINFHDGHVEDEICTESGDTINSLNIKRAVASMFQAALKSTEESDVFGKCPNDISSRKEGAYVIVQKSRDLTRCSHRESIKQDFLATSFNIKAVAGASPMISHMDAEQKIKNGILESSSITENYLYKPLSDGKEHGVKATVSTKLTLAGQSKEKISSKATEPRGIFFENPHLEPVKASNVDSILAALKETKKTMDVSVTETSAKTFYQLINVLRESRKDDILAVYGQVKTGAGGFKDKEGARKVFFDALFRAGTGDAVEVVIELLKNKEMSPAEQKLVYLSFSFIKHATKGSLASAAALLDQAKLPREAYLGIGTLAGRYCSEHPCDNVDELNKLMQKLTSKLVPNPTDRNAENEAIAVLKALGNVGHLPEGPVIDKIIQIANQKNAPTRLRVAALEAAESDACHPKLQAAALNLLKNRQEDSEIRIKAYLVVAECPDAKSAAAIQELLDTEPVYQVGGYIVSHLRNLRASANPDRERAQQHLSNVHSARHFPIDPRKYSFNSELSYNWDTLGAGNVLESDVIYSQQSYLPRSVHLNVTTELFGHSFNMFEVGVRQENWDKLLEHYLGPLGVFSTEKPEDLLKSGKKSMHKIAEHIKARFEKTRSRRDVSRSEIDAFAKQVKILGSELNKDLEYDLSLKLFGSEMLFLSLNENIEHLTPDGIVDKIFDCLDEGIEKAKGFEYHLKNHVLFMDTEISYPTSMGFPLKWYLQGTAAVHLITSGSIDLKQILRDPKNAQLKMKVIPSANIDLTGGISFDAQVIRTGLQITTNILTSTGTDVTFKLLDNKGVDVKLGLPVEKQKLISFSHNLEFATQEQGKKEVALPLKFKDKQKEFAVCFDQLSPIIGLNFCGELASPSTLQTNHVAFPLNGNIKLEVMIERDDVSEYHFKALLKEPSSHSKQIEVTFATPGSKQNRDVSLLLEASLQPNKVLRAVLKSPLKEATAEAMLTDTAQEKSAMLRFQYDKNEYLAKIGVAVKGNEAKQVYEPLIEYQTPNDIVKTKGPRKPDYTVEGQVTVEKTGDNRKFNFDHIKLISPGQPPIQINGHLAKEGPTSYSADLEVSRESVTIHGKGRVAYDADSVKLNAEMQNSVNPNANFNIKVDLKKGDHEFDSSIMLIHGKDLSSKKHQLTVQNSAKYKYENKDTFDFSTKNKIQYPLLNVEGKMDAHVTRHLVSYDLTIAYDKFKLESELDAKHCQKELGDYDVKFDIEAMSNKLELKAKRDINGDKSTIANSLEITGRKYSVNGVVTHHVKPNDINIGCDLTIKIHEKPEPIKIDTNLMTNTKELDSHAKISVGATAIVDIVIKGARSANPSGSLKVFIKELVTANGNFKVAAGKGDGDLLIEIPKMGRKLKADTSFTCQSPTHNLVLNIFFDFEKDNTKKLHFETKNELTKKSIESKNTLELMDYKMTANVNGKLDGELNNGKLTGDAEIILPNKHILSGKIERDLRVADHLANLDGHLHLGHQEAAGGPKRTFDIKAHAKNSNLEKGEFDITYNVVAVNADASNIKADIELKHGHNGAHKHLAHFKGKIYGSVLTHPLEAEFNGDYSHVEGIHKASIACGPKMALKVGAAYNFAEDKPCLCNLEIEAITPNEKYNNLKLKIDGKSLIPKDAVDGTYEVESNVIATLNNDKSIKLHGDAKASLNAGQFKFDVVLPDNEPLGVAAKYNRDKTETGGKIHGEVQLQYAKDKQVKAGLTLNKVNDDEMDFEVILATPSEHAKNINLHVTNKKSSNNKQFHTEINLTADDKKYALVNEMLISDISPSLDLKLTHPDGKVSHILAKFNRVSAKHYNAQVNIENIKDFNLEASGDADLESVDDFHIKLAINSEKLKLDKVKIEVFNKSNKGGKKIQFEAKSGSKNLLSGSTTYKANEEGGKFIVEGSGTVKVKEESKTATFKYIKHQLEQDKDGEQGINVVLNAAIGNQGVVGELKLSNKQFRLKNSYCEEKQQCAYVEVHSKTNTIDAAEFSHDLEMNMDLRKLGLSHEFGLKAVTKRKNFVLDHTVDIHFESSANSKYQYSLYVHPKEAGVQFTSPKRQISLEAKGDYDHKKGTKSGKVSAEVALYMNKKTEPTKKAVLSYSCEHGFDDNAGHANVDVKFSNPGMSKEMAISHSSKYDLAKKSAEFTLDLDVFAKKNQKVTITGKSSADKIEHGYKVHADANIVSKGLNLDIKYSEDISASTKGLLDYDFKLNYQLDKTKLDNAITVKVNAKQMVVLLKALNKNVVNIEANMALSKDSQVVDSTVTVIGLGDYLTHTEIKNFNTFMHTIAKKATPQNKFRISSGFIVGQIADFRVDFDKQGGQKNEILHASIKLDDAHFLKPDFGMNAEFIEKGLVPAIKSDAASAMKNLKGVAEEYSKTLSTEAQHLSDLAKKSVPNLKPSAEYYKQELLKLKDELISDKTLQEVGEFLKKIMGAVAHTISEVYAKVNELSDKIVALTSDNFSKITDIIAKDVLPTIKEIGGKLFDVYMSLMKSLYDLVMLYVVRLAEILKAHQAEIKHAVTVLSEAFQDFGRLFVKFFNQIKDDLQVIGKNLYDQLKALPIFEEMKQRYEDLLGGLPVPEQFVHILEDVSNTIKDVMPTEELKQFVKVIQDYVAKKMRKEAVDDAEALKQIYNSLVKAINSLVKFVQNQQVAITDYKTILDNIIPVRFDRFYGIPQLSAMKLSPVNYLLSGDLPSYRQFINGQSLKNLLPPFTDHAMIIQGQHIFTFDQRHLTFPGKCAYVLAKDAVNGNFTIIGQYKDGHLEALTFADKTDVITMKSSGKVSVNGKEQELPVRHENVEVFRLYDTVHLVAKAGVTILMEPDLNAVGVYVSGFYHGQLRGLLGNANNEPYDDFTMANGKITDKEADFGNTYRLSGKCADVKTIDHRADHKNDKCEALFGRDQPWAICYPLVDRTLYKQACEHGLATANANTEKYISIAFAAECRHRGIPINIPKQFVKCENGESRDLNDEFSVKVPTKSADIVVVVEQNKANEAVFKELIQPVITQLTNELNAKGISDIEYSLMGYGGEYQRYPSHYTNGGKLAFNAKLQNLKFADEAAHVPVDLECTYANELLERVRHYVHEARYQLTMTPEGDALRECLRYPFRAGAARVILFVKGSNHVRFSPLHLLAKYVSAHGPSDGIHMNLVTPLDTLKLAGGKDAAKQAKSIVGFNDKHAFTLDPKKKTDHQDIEHALDYGVSYFVGRHHGNVFSATNFNQAKGQKKNFVQVMAHVIAEDIVNTEYGFDCKCERSGPFRANNVCKVSNIKQQQHKH